MFVFLYFFENYGVCQQGHTGQVYAYCCRIKIQKKQNDPHPTSKKHSWNQDEEVPI